MSKSLSLPRFLLLHGYGHHILDDLLQTEATNRAREREHTGAGKPKPLKTAYMSTMCANIPFRRCVFHAHETKDDKLRAKIHETVLADRGRKFDERIKQVGSICLN